MRDRHEGEEVRGKRMLRGLCCLITLGCVLAALGPAQALTTAGTVISETATATYCDASVCTYTATGNTVTTYVQNSPSLVAAVGGTLGGITPYQYGVDSFTLTNTGNASGNIKMPSAVAVTGPVTLIGYMLNNVSTGTCSQTSPCVLATLQAQAGLNGIAAGSAISIGVVYQVNGNAAPNASVQFTITGDIVYAAGANGILAETSSNASSTITDTVDVDARLDLQETASQPSALGQPITWTVTANNGGQGAAFGLLSVQTLFGTSAPGIALYDKLPTYGGSLVPLNTCTSNPTVSLGVPTNYSGIIATLYYSTVATPTAAANWSTTCTVGARWIAVFVYLPGFSQVLYYNPTGSGGAGNVTSATPQITLSFTTSQPTGVGSGSIGSVTNIVNSDIGGNLSWGNGEYNVSPIYGAGITLGTFDTVGQALSATETNTTPSSGTTMPGGTSNSIGSQAYGYGVALGSGAAVEVGAWSAGTVPGYTSGSATTNNDFTFVGFATSTTPVNTATASAGAPSGNTLTTLGSAVPINSNIQNTGIINDTYTLSNNTIAGWTVAYYQSNCSTALASNQIALTAGTNAVICVKFTPPATVTAYTAYDFDLTATSVASSAFTDQVHDVLYPGGAIVIFKTYAVGGCPGGVTPANSGVITGCTITVTVTAVNESPVSAAGGGSSTNTGFTGSNIVVTQNAAAGSNTWGGSTTNGISAAPTLTGCASCTTTGTSGSTNFTVTIPTLAPQATASFAYALVVK
jgi:hypothetical protein